RSTCMSAIGCRGFGQKTMPTWSKGCARPAGGRSEAPGVGRLTPHYHPDRTTLTLLLTGLQITVRAKATTYQRAPFPAPPLPPPRSPAHSPGGLGQARGMAGTVGEHRHGGGPSAPAAPWNRLQAGQPRGGYADAGGVPRASADREHGPIHEDGRAPV